jgi:hypothetical protein
MRGAMPGQAFDFDFGNILYFSYYSEEYKHHDSDSSMGCSPMGYLPYACLSLVISKIGVVTNARLSAETLVKAEAVWDLSDLGSREKDLFR